MLGRRRALASLFFLCGGILIDQGSKAWAVQTFAGGVICNPEGAWGIPVPNFFLLMLSGGIGCWVVWKEWRQPSEGYVWMLFGAGAIGNMIDRFVYGCVIDFISVFSFPVFNVADIFLTLGVCLLGAAFWKEHSSQKSRREAGSLK